METEEERNQCQMADENIQLHPARSGWERNQRRARRYQINRKRSSLKPRLTTIIPFMRHSRPSTPKGDQSFQMPEMSGEKQKRKITLDISIDDDEDKYGDLIEAIRSGNLDTIKMLLQDDLPHCLTVRCSFEILLKGINQQKNDQNVENDFGRYGAVNMKVYLFHMAIIGQWNNVVKLFLEETYARFGTDVVMKILESQTTLDIKNEEIYCPEHRALNKMTSLHVAARFDSKSLAVILEFLKSKNLLKSAQDILDDQSNGMEMTPLHAAVLNPDSSATMLLLNHDPDLLAKDSRGFTPLHIAARNTNEDILTALLNRHINTHVTIDPRAINNKTPLHRARTKRMVQILLDFGADPLARLDIVKNESDSGNIHEAKQECAFNVLLKRNPEAAELVLDSFIRSYHDLDSPDLIIVMDLRLFLNNGLEESDMATHKEVVNIGQKYLLKHPLMNFYLHAKWHFSRRMLYANLFLYFLFLLALTSLAGLQVAMTNTDKNATLNICYCKGTTCPDLLSSVTETIPSLYCQENKTNFLEIVDCCPNKNATVAFCVLYTLTSIGVIVMGIRELLQMACTGMSYIRVRDNLIESLIVISTVSYLATIFTNLVAAKHLSAWSVFLGWIDLTLLIGRMPNVGIYIYMSFHIIKTLVHFIFVFFPVLAAFAFGFFILLPLKSVFDNPFTSILKVIVMMIGEYNLEAYFTWTASTQNLSFVTTQVFFVLFIFFVSIVLVNLIVGLTVNKTEEIFSETDLYRLEKTVLQIVSQEEAMEQICFALPKKRQKMVTRRASIFDDIKNNESPFHSYDSTNFKICIMPNQIDQSQQSFWDMRPSFYSSVRQGRKSHKIYTIRESTLNRQTELQFKLPGWFVVDIMDYLRVREKQNEISNLYPNFMPRRTKYELRSPKRKNNHP